MAETGLKVFGKGVPLTDVIKACSAAVNSKENKKYLRLTLNRLVADFMVIRPFHYRPFHSVFINHLHTFLSHGFLTIKKKNYNCYEENESKQE